MWALAKILKYHSDVCNLVVKSWIKLCWLTLCIRWDFSLSPGNDSHNFMMMLCFVLVSVYLETYVLQFPFVVLCIKLSLLQDIIIQQFCAFMCVYVHLCIMHWFVYYSRTYLCWKINYKLFGWGSIYENPPKKASCAWTSLYLQL